MPPWIGTKWHMIWDGVGVGAMSTRKQSDAQIIEALKQVEAGRRENNQASPHSSLGCQTPEAFAAGAAPPVFPPTLAGIFKT